MMTIPRPEDMEFFDSMAIYLPLMVIAFFVIIWWIRKDDYEL